MPSYAHQSARLVGQNLPAYVLTIKLDFQFAVFTAVGLFGFFQKWSIATTTPLSKHVAMHQLFNAATFCLSFVSSASNFLQFFIPLVYHPHLDPLFFSWSPFVCFFFPSTHFPFHSPLTLLAFSTVVPTHALINLLTDWWELS